LVAAEAELARDLLEPAADLGDVDGVGDVPGIRTPAASNGRVNFSGVCPPSRDDLPLARHLEHILERERLEEQLVRRAKSVGTVCGFS
jgi:hypothetical protein